MNERIDALIDQMDQSGLPYQADDYSMTVTGRDLEYLAELIVRECIKVAIFKDSGYMHPADVAGYMAAGRSTAAHMIKQHFGVEE